MPADSDAMQPADVESLWIPCGLTRAPCVWADSPTPPRPPPAHRPAGPAPPGARAAHLRGAPAHCRTRTRVLTRGPGCGPGARVRERARQGCADTADAGWQRPPRQFSRCQCGPGAENGLLRDSDSVPPAGPGAARVRRTGPGLSVHPAIWNFGTPILKVSSISKPSISKVDSISNTRPSISNY